jgi:predicted site-specific integrase-resolvase
MSCLLEPLLEPTKVARLLGVEVETLGAWRRKGYGPRWHRIGKKIKYAEPDLRLWMNAQANPADGQQTTRGSR